MTATPLRRYLAVPLGTRLVAAFALGAACGLIAGPAARVLAPLSDLFILALRVIAVPAVAIYILYALSDVGLRHLGRLGAPLLALFVVWSAAAASLGVGAALALSAVAGPLLTPGPAVHAPAANPAWPSARPTFGIDSALALAVLLAVPAALVTAAARHRGDRAWAHGVHRLAGRAAALLAFVIRMVMEYAPVGVFALAAITFAASRSPAATGLPLALVSVYLAQLLLATALGLAVTIRRRSPRAFLSDSREAVLTALATGSSAATVPVELRSAHTLMAVPPPVASVAIGVGATLCKVGTTAFLGALVVWAAVLSGTETPPHWLWRAAAASTIAGMLTPPVSGGGFVMLGFVTMHMGLPAPLVPLLAGVPFIGKLNTPLNALGRLTCACLASPSRVASANGTAPAPMVDSPAQPSAP